MEQTTYRGIVQDGNVRLLENVSLANDTEVLVVPIVPRPGTAAAVLAAMSGPPHLPSAWVDELEQLIAEGR
jgi:hypothetical protein